jgi:hypothetical protein
MSFTNAIQILWYCNIAASFALLIRLLIAGLARSYRSLLFYIAADFTEGIFGLWLPAGNWSAIVYFIGQTAKLFVAVVIALEIYWDGLAKHRALARFGQRLAGGAILTACALALLGLTIDPGEAKGPYAIPHYYFVYERSVDWVVLILLIVICGFMGWFSIPVRKNFGVYVWVFMLYFFAHSVGLMLLNSWPALRNQVSVGQLAFSLVCVLILTFFLRRRGEAMGRFSGPGNPASLEKLEADLNAINIRLERMSQ